MAVTGSSALGRSEARSTDSRLNLLYAKKMTAGIHRLNGSIYLALISLAASLLGSLLAAGILSIIEADGMQAVLTALLIFAFGIWLAVPVGWLVGVPTLAVTSRILPKHVVLTTLLFSIAGLIGGFALQRWGGEIGLEKAFVVFGACVGGMHPLVYSHSRGGGRSGLATALLLSGAVVPPAAYAGESVLNLIESRSEFAARCADPYGSMAFVAAKAALEPFSNRDHVGQGKWYNQRRWRSLYASERWISLDEARVLIARDYAYVPGGFAGRITGGRRVESHCLSEKKGSAAALLRRQGFGQRPTLDDLED